MTTAKAARILCMYMLGYLVYAALPAVVGLVVIYGFGLQHNVLFGIVVAIPVVIAGTIGGVRWAHR